VRIVEETYLPGNSVSIVARRYGIAGNQLFTWRRLMAQGAFTAAGAGEEVVQRLEPSMTKPAQGSNVRLRSRPASHPSQSADIDPRF
jgi:transposase-like protein